MYSWRPASTGSAAIVVLLFYSVNASALIFEPGVSGGMKYSDNAALTANNKEDEWIFTSSVRGSVKETGGPLTVDAASSLSFVNYRNNTFSDQYYFNLDMASDWTLLKNRLNLNMRDSFVQRKVDSIEAVTPDNLQDTNVFSIGPEVIFPITSLQRLSLKPEYRNFYYEETDAENQQYAFTANWNYQLFSQAKIGVSGNATKVDFDDEKTNPNYTSRNASVTASFRQARSDYSINLGVTNVDRDRFGNQEGSTGSFNWLLNLTRRSSVRTFIASELTDTGINTLNALTAPGRGDVNDVQVSGDVFRNNTARAEYIRTDSTLNSNLWVELRNLDYKETLEDREIISTGISLRYQVSALFSTGFNGTYIRTRQTDIKRRDNEYAVSGSIEYRLSRKLRTLFNIRLQNKDSTSRGAEYKEFSTFISLVYGIGGAYPSRIGVRNPVSSRQAESQSRFVSR